MSIPTPEYKLQPDFFQRKVEEVARDIIGRYLIVHRRDADPVAAQLTQVAAYEGTEKSSAPTMKYAPGMIGISVKFGSRLIDIACGTGKKPACITLRAGIVYRPDRNPEIVLGPGNLSKALGFDDHMDSTPINTNSVWFAGQALPDYLVARIIDEKKASPNHRGTFKLEPNSLQELLETYLQTR